VEKSVLEYPWDAVARRIKVGPPGTWGEEKRLYVARTGAHDASFSKRMRLRFPGLSNFSHLTVPLEVKERCYTLYRKAGKTQEEIADLCGIGQSCVSLYIREMCISLEGVAYDFKRSLSDEEVEEIRRIRASVPRGKRGRESKGTTYRAIAERFGVSQQLIIFIVTGRLHRPSSPNQRFSEASNGEKPEVPPASRRTPPVSTSRSSSRKASAEIPRSTSCR